MTIHSQEDHLNYDDVLIAVVDAGDLPANRQRHLESCTVCRREVGRVEQRFRTMGRIARESAPAPQRPFRLPLATRRRAAWQLKPLMAAGLAAACLLLLVVLNPLATRQSPDPSLSEGQFSSDANLMREVDALVENALPEPYRHLASGPEPMTMDEDLINWIVPSING